VIIVKKYWVFILILSLISAGVGWFWGSGAQILFASNTELPLFGNGIENPYWLGGLLGIIFGFTVGVLYAFRLIGLVEGGYGLGKAITSGVLAGLICSSLVHIFLMLFYKNSHLAPIGIGALFGIFSGAALGLVAGGIFVAYYNRKHNTN
jgi:hypothetical protein